jgi:hypothetical protein
MLPKRNGGIGEGYSKIIAIDAGNCSDVYQIVNFTRQYELEVNRVLQTQLLDQTQSLFGSLESLKRSKVTITCLAAQLIMKDSGIEQVKRVIGW